MIDHTGHPHPSTPKARALCRANGGTGFIGKIGGDAPVAKKGDNDKKPHVPRGPVNTTPKTPKPPAAPPVKKGPTVPKDHGDPKPPTAKKPEAPTATGGERDITPKHFDKTKMQIKDGKGNWRTVATFIKAPGGGSRSAGARGGQYSFRDAEGNLIREASPNERITVRDMPSKTPFPAPLPVPGERKISPGDFNAEVMEIRGPDGTWNQVGSVESGSSAVGGTLIFVDKNGKVIDAVPRSGTISVRPKQPNPDKVPEAGHMTDFIPPATGKGSVTGSAARQLQLVKIQNALRLGASRDFIVKGSKLSEEDTNKVIDNMLVQYGVPNHVYPRKGSGGSGPKATDVKPAAPKVVAKKVADTGSVPTPTTPDTVGLAKVQGAVNVDPRVKAAVDRVLKIQSDHVGGKITRIKSIDNNLPDPESTRGKALQIHEGTFAVCMHDGKIHLHKDMHNKGDAVNYSMESGWFTKGGQGIEQTIAHEMGHAFLTDFKMTPNQRKILANTLVEEFNLKNPYGGDVPFWGVGQLDRVVQHPDNKKKLKSAVSKYGTTNANELIAEVWAEYTMNPRPRPKIKKLGDVLKGLIEGRIK